MRRAVHLWPIGALALALACLQCEGEWSFVIPGWDAGAPSALYASACGAWAKSSCDHADRCPGPIYDRWTSHSQCVERSTLNCELVADDPNVSFDADLVAACSFPDDCSAPLPPLFCLSQGKAPVGASCMWAEGCQTLNCQRRLDETTQSSPTCGVCRPVTACDRECPAGARCLSETDGGVVCVTAPTVGQACGEPLYICLDSYCQRESVSGLGICTAWAKLGEACGNGATGPACFSLGESYCDDTQHCRPYVPAAYGESCLPSKGGAGYACTAWGACDFANSGRCVPPSPDGAPCDEVQGFRCLPPAMCIAHHCLFPSLADCSL